MVLLSSIEIKITILKPSYYFINDPHQLRVSFNTQSLRNFKNVYLSLGITYIFCLSSELILNRVNNDDNNDDRNEGGGL